jgi:hypothetical protein
MVRFLPIRIFKKISLMLELHTYLSLLLSFSILFHPHHNVLESLALDVGALTWWLLKMSRLPVALEIFAFGAHILWAKGVSAVVLVLTARFSVTRTAYNAAWHVQKMIILHAHRTRVGSLTTSRIARLWVFGRTLGFLGDHMCLSAARWWLSIVIIIHVHFDTFK